jgi:very-short-patch-repair endonuclease
LDGGERRLNVLITRAKLRCRVFSSITADQIDLGRTKARGVAALKVFLRYADIGILDTPGSHSGGATDSPFEDSVKAALEKHGHTIHTQVGTAGFFIDLAIVDPSLPGRYLLGIECDGATYHSARSARERDRQRQAVLEDHGWAIHRIWSADWFQKPEEQLRKALAAIEATTRNPSGRSEPPIDPQPSIERDPARPVEGLGDNSLAVAYALAALSVPNYIELHEVPVAHLARIVEEILGIEAPIHTEEIITRVRQIWGVGRAGARIRGAVEQALQYLLADHRAKKQGDFVTIGTTELRIRDRSLLPAAAGARKPEYLPPGELDLAICTAVTVNHGVSPDELPGAVSRLLGFSALGTGLRGVIDRRIAALKHTQAIVLDNGFFRVVG